MRVETYAALRDQLAQWSFSTEEFAALIWLGRWHQTGGGDPVKFLRHWEFLRRLVKVGRLKGYH